MKRAVDLALENGIDAVIAADQATIQYAHQQGMEVHLSTQVNISNAESLLFYSGFADVAVLARELNLDQVAVISRRIESRRKLQVLRVSSMRVELFAHGALVHVGFGKMLSQPASSQPFGQPGRLSAGLPQELYTVTEKESGIELEIDNEYHLVPERSVHNSFHQ